MNLHKILSAHKGALGCNITVIAMWNPVGISIPHIAMPAVILWTDGRTNGRKDGGGSEVFSGGRDPDTVAQSA